MKQSLQLRLGQHLTMTPQLQQAIRLLQLSALDLQTEIQQALDSNPMLEAEEPGAGSSSEEQQGLESGENYTSNSAGDDASADDAGVAQGEAAPEANMDLHNAEMPTELPVDGSWEDIYDGPATVGSGASQDTRGFETQGRSNETLHDHLIWQMELTPFSEIDMAIATAIIDSINEDGYLTSPLEEIYQSLATESDIDLDEVEAVLHRIQSFDPPGVGARDLRECLLIQLRQLDPATPWLDSARQLVQEYLPLLANRDYTQLMRRMKLQQQDLQAVISMIQSLNARPGSLVVKTEPEYITPDVSVRKQNGKWRVELNQEAMPRIRINSTYAGLIRRADNSSDNVYLKNNLQEARWFIKSIQSRNETLLKVATCIVERQRGFLEHGEEAMKALVLHDVAEAVGMHESTISRITSQKYMHTPRGIVELKYFFSSHVSTASGGACSSTAIRALIRKLIAAENAVKPLSDSKIAEVLSEQGINVARRTVAKYREAMSIPPSNERKRLA